MDPLVLGASAGDSANPKKLENKVPIPFHIHCSADPDPSTLGV